MTNLPPRHIIQNVRRLEDTMSELDLMLPKAVSEAMKTAATVADRFSARPPHDLIEATMQALGDDIDPATDPRVQAAASSIALGSFDQSLVAVAAAARTATVAAEHADAIVKVLRPPFDSAAAELAAHHATLAGLDLDDVNAATRSGPAAAAALSSARHHVLPRLNAVIAAWSALSALADPYRMTPTTNIELRLAWCEPDPAKWIKAGLDRVKLPAVTLPYVVLTDGHRLSLATLEEYDDRVAAITQAHIDAHAQQEAAVAFARRKPSLI